ncbi:MAG TPA: glycoside hydrolase family 20 zincin-like fold domain-containing protein [Phycisphaerae bacterium]|nr:glycoside hydrolase family 20 zincin-like fold domain-containing protein [Phycisphaerae bacterium]
MTERFRKSFISRLIPEPQKIIFNGNTCTIDEKMSVTLEISECDDAIRTMVKERFKSYFGVAVDVKIGISHDKITHDGYKLIIEAHYIKISAYGGKGVDYALKTLRQLAEPERNDTTFHHYILPECTIEDFPKMDFRGIHLCIFPETPMWVVEKELRLAAYYKFNYAVIEAWGVFPFRSHPEFCWPDKKKDISEFEHLKGVADECGITLIPQFNILGHASGSRCGTAKHAIIDFRPELQPLFEPSGWCFCLSNPAVRGILSDIVLELHDFWGHSPFFHVGCDEADGLAVCSECLKHDVKELVKEHICYFHELMAQRKTRIIMWHDMLLNRQDSRWRDCVAFGNEELATLYNELPRDIVIADWQYDLGQKDNQGMEYPTSVFFKKENFDVVMCPWQEAKGTQNIGAMIENHKLFGLLETTWHTAHAFNFFAMFGPAAMVAWRGADFKQRLWWLDMAAHIRQIGYDMNVTSYEQTGCAMNQIMAVTTQV